MSMLKESDGRISDRASGYCAPLCNFISISCNFCLSIKGNDQINVVFGICMDCFFEMKLDKIDIKISSSERLLVLECFEIKCFISEGKIEVSCL